MRILKAFFWIFGLGLLGWTGYAIYDMTSWKNSLDPADIFCSKDEKVLVIHKPNSYDWNQIEFSTLSENKNIVDPLLSNLPSNGRVYISKTRNFILLENEVEWTEESLKKCLSSSKLRYSIDDGKIKIEQLFALRAKNKLLIYKYEEDVEGMEWNWSDLDENATASIVSFSKSRVDFVDIYSKNDNTVEFHTKNIKGVEGKIVDDISTFQSYIPSKSKDYIFYENTYLKSLDSDYRKGPIQNFVGAGLCSFIFENQRIVLCQFKEGQNAVQNLNEFFQKEEDNSLFGRFDNLMISNKLKAGKASYFVKTIDNIAIFSQNEEVIDTLLKEIEIGKTWLYNEEELNVYLQNLPKTVSYRSFDKFINKSVSVFGSKIIETYVKFKSEKLLLNTDLEYLSVSISGKIKDFESFSGKGNIVCLTEDGKIIGIENGLKTWKKDIDDKPVGEMQVLKTKDEEYLVVTALNSIHIISRFGKYLEGYPLKWTNSEFICSSNAFIYKGQVSVGVVTSSNSLVIFNSAGKLSNEINLKDINGVSNIDFFTVDGRLHGTLLTSDKIIIYALSEKKVVKQVQNINSAILVDVPNLSLISYSNSGRLIYTKYPGSNDQGVSDISTDEVIESKMIDSSLYTISMSGNKAFISKNGKNILIEKDLANSRINSGDILKNSFKEIYFAVLDVIGNGVFLYDEKGRMYVKGKIEGTRKVSLNQGSGYSVLVTTVIDGYLIQYLLK